jgi:thiamine-monophosphate kinase
MAETPSRPSEFELIARHFAPLAEGAPGAAGLTDDVATFRPTPGCETVLTVDAMVEGVHFLAADPPALVGRKLLRVNLSDLAAKGAVPRTYLLALSLPDDIGESWIAGFAEGLARDQAEFGVVLSGGDTTSTPGATTLSLTAIGEAPEGTVIRRAGASPGNDIYVTGTVGDAGLGLKAMAEFGTDDALARWPDLVGRLRLPRPRVRLGPALRGVASAAADISDGIVADLGHICLASGVSANIEVEAVPLSEAAIRLLAERPDWRDAVLGGGDDYEILFTAPPGMASRLKGLSREFDTAITRIGVIAAGAGVTVRDAAGAVVKVQHDGWRHF